MYDKEALKRFIAKHGVDDAIKYFSSDDLPLHIKEDLTKIHVFNSDGYLCLSFLYSL